MINCGVADESAVAASGGTTASPDGVEFGLAARAPGSEAESTSSRGGKVTAYQDAKIEKNVASTRFNDVADPGGGLHWA